MKVKALLVIALSGLFLSGAIAQTMSEEDIKQRIKPVGQVKVAGAVDATVAAGPRSGADIYAAACTACHAVGVLGAPKTKIAADWQPRLDEKGFDQVWQNAINGIGAMPAMGACGDCTDDDIKAAIDYMIEGI
ncbi:c-type cytochrome [Glaciecola sp. XM2]|uniref:c-type cytochrome n=1 Tax=Glaciecola sp. XM2 TaxID=1914931 RepID=UPI001BDE6A7B|nr:c-type cytochrome [Glaciecola sp. XM2]